MAGKFIQIAAHDGGTFRGYLALPRDGKGPAIVLCQEIFGINAYVREVADYYAEEGYVVLAPDLFWRMEKDVDLGYTPEDWQKAFGFFQKFDVDLGVKDIASAVKALRAMPEVSGKVGALGFCLGGKLAYLAAARAGVDCAVGYYGVGIEGALDEKINVPLVLHIAGEDQFVPKAAQEQIRQHFKNQPQVEIYTYPGTDHAFARTGGDHYDKPAAMMAHSRSIALFRKVMGPHYDLSALWDKHCEYEFGIRDVDATMGTMVAEPYVNHIPTMTGGVGYKHLKRFYKHHFVNSNPKDTKLIPISRTIGADRVVDEMLFCFTHDSEIDWMLPGVKPTGKYVEIPLVAIISFRGDKLYNEHIYWDQASVLVQIGLLDAKNLPVAGIETAKKLLDEKQPSNTLMKRWAESEGKD
ncbi:dienelactone hydrolase family protein [Dongia soli]|uniref:Dienelactone hydrolase family protein n=1 Tax=Dongia soli TaxID=600628 RepID=A0ABU5EFP0_9PROT|nr:dienelactone hydrolase family protein [Dongia soli]MDY0885012.1 dienelactone hydrolase family protein [Dongia soli]